LYLESYAPSLKGFCASHRRDLPWYRGRPSMIVWGNFEGRSSEREIYDDLEDAPDLRGLLARGTHEGLWEARHDLRPGQEDARETRAVGLGSQGVPASPGPEVFCEDILSLRSGVTPAPLSCIGPAEKRNVQHEFSPLVVPSPECPHIPLERCLSRRGGVTMVPETPNTNTRLSPDSAYSPYLCGI
jgi:hypothetical protein